MSTVPRRYRSSTSASARQGPSKALDVLRNLFHRLEAHIEAGSQSYPDTSALIETLQQICQHLTQPTPPNPPQDDFRFTQGFQRLLGVLRAFSGFYDPSKRTVAEVQSFFDLLNVTLRTFAAAFCDNPGNKRAFKYRLEGGGWEALEQALASIGFGGNNTAGWVYCRLFGELLTFALHDDKLRTLSASISTSRLAEEHFEDGEDFEHISREEATAPIRDGPIDGEGVNSQLDKAITATSAVRYPEIFRAVVGFWESMPRTAGTSTDGSSVWLLTALHHIISVSVYNLAALQSADVFSRFIRLAFAGNPILDAPELETVLEICASLLYLGVNDPSDAQFLLSSTAPGASEFCLQIASKYTSPPTFHFDLSIQGYSAIELRDLGRPFPPSSSPGYTFTAWIQIHKFDPSSHTTVFGIYDASQTCFLLVYLEMDTRNFILQTSVTHQKPSVRFKAAKFVEDKWYHIALVHAKPKAMAGSKARLFVNGALVEQMRCNYPLPPPFTTNSSETFASFTSSNGKSQPVHAFIGTPKDLSSHVGAGLVQSKWALASAHLFDDILSDEFLAVHHGLGPHYQGNFQDSLGSFQTYAASATLGLRNETPGPGASEKSDITRAIRDKASTVLPESKIALSVLPTAVFQDDARYHEHNLLRNLPRPSRTRLFDLARKSESPIAINAAVPYLPDNILCANGLASLVGNSIVVSVPAYLDTNLWRLGGFSVISLKLIERATSADEMIRAVEMMFSSIQNSWRNSEAMERDSGYGILAMMLRAKLGFPGSVEGMPAKLTLTAEERDHAGLRLLSLILGFVGYNHGKPHESFIINPLAYRILLIDLDIWRRMSPMVQQIYYKQFLTFSVESKHHQFNGSRLQRMRTVKRLLEALKGELMMEDVLPYFLEAFKTFVQFNCSNEVMRYLAVFITFSLHSASASLPRTPRSHSSVSRSSTPVPMRRPALDVIMAAMTSASGTAPKTLTRKQLGIKLLEMYSDLLCKDDKTLIMRFAQTVTNRVRHPNNKGNAVLTAAQWLLYLLTEDDAEVVVHGCKILARVLVAHGPAYTSNFAGKSGGFVIMAQRLKRWWDIPTLWPICFSILFGFDVAEITFTRNFDFFSLLELFAKSKVIYGESLIILTSMLQHGLKDVLRNQADPDSPLPQQKGTSEEGLKPRPATRPRSNSMELSKALESRSLPPGDRDRVAVNAGTLQTVTRFLSDLYNRSADFRGFALSSEYIRLLLIALYPAIVSADPVTADVELQSRETPLNFSGGDVMIRPLSSASLAPVVRTSRVTTASPAPPGTYRGTPLKKASSFILLTPQELPVGPSTAKLRSAIPAKSIWASHSIKSDVLESFLELIVAVFIDQVIARKEFPGFGLFLKVPPGFQEHQAYFESYILRNTISHLENTIKLDPKVICEPKVLTNMARFHVHITEAIFEGWFMGGAEAMMDFAGTVLEYLQRPEIAMLKSVRLCSQAVNTIRICFLKTVLLRLSELDDGGISDTEATELMNKILYWQMALLGGLTNEDDFLRLLCYQLYTKLVDGRRFIRCAAAHLLRILLVQKPEESSTLLRQCSPPELSQLIRNFNKLTEVDDETFVEWVDQNRSSLDIVFFRGMSKTWEEWVTVENQRTINAANTRAEKRRERLKLWHNERLHTDNVVLRHELANASWTKMIWTSEQYKHQRLTQDQQDNLGFMAATYSRMELDLRRPGALFSEKQPLKWKLDRTEGRNRMRLRLMPDFANSHQEFQPKRRNPDTLSATTLRVNTAAKRSNSSNSTGVLLPTLHTQSPLPVGNDTMAGAGVYPASAAESRDQLGVEPEDDFEMVQDPVEANENDEGFEDKNRKVMRQLERGDTVQAAYNISRIVGLEACEGICIVGKEALYIMDNVFQCASGEIVNVWDAPTEERDPFSQIVTDSKTSERRQNSGRKEQESRSWKWHDVISLSKRQFLFRDVAIEVFFTDGRSYLLAALNHTVRDELFNKVLNKAPHTNAASSLPNPEDGWRLEVVKVSDESNQGLGRFGNIFTSSPSNPVLKRWQRGEISNFHYLMIVNTMAGRTFNDLTQYPVFPWVLADYASEDLDLTNPASFRDLTKPMGAQTLGRVLGYRENYKALQEGGDHPFHYGTHYSSAMIVVSYLIRLPPFVQSFILLQGGTFDHADRLFQSIPAAWKSASQDTSTDVRELIPEFFCLPEFLTNINGYDFGTRQSDERRVDHVELPPWAKGDPSIFIAKHREALESPYVSQNLHHWIDLVFGHKQKGHEAVEALNVFYHLSYRGSANLDDITDPKEREIAAGVIHNFGQTPHQVFTKAHPQRESSKYPARRLDTAVYGLGALPTPLLESTERVASLTYAAKLDRLLVAVPFRVNFSPYDKFIEWGYADNSVRFYFCDHRKPAGLFEGFHIGQISCVAFVDSKTLITAGEDCVIAVHSIQTSSGKPVDMTLKSSLFGHRTPVRTIAVSKAFSTFVSVSEEGQALLWDINRLKFIRKLPLTRPVQCARINDVTGDIMLCSGANVMLYTLNGSLLLDQNICAEEEDDCVLSCAFYEGSGNEWLENSLVFTGHKRGRVNVWNKIITKEGKWKLDFLRRLDHVDAKSPSGANYSSAITCITPLPRCVYTGDEDGRVFEWNFQQRDR